MNSQILFSWPSKAELTGYIADKDAVTLSRDALAHLVTRPAAERGVRGVKLVAHSMGSWLTMEVVRQIRIASHVRTIEKLNDVTLAAPDIDRRRPGFDRLEYPAAVQSATRCWRPLRSASWRMGGKRLPSARFRLSNAAPALGEDQHRDDGGPALGAVDRERRVPASEQALERHRQRDYGRSPLQIEGTTEKFGVEWATYRRTRSADSVSSRTPRRSLANETMTRGHVDISLHREPLARIDMRWATRHRSLCGHELAVQPLGKKCRNGLVALERNRARVWRTSEDLKSSDVIASL